MNPAQIYTLSKPQKTLVMIGIAVFVICLAVAGVSLANFINDKYNRPIKILNATGAPVDQNTIPQSMGFRYGDTIEQLTGYSTLGWNGIEATFFPGTKAVITEDNLTITNGYTYLAATTGTQLIIENTSIALSNVKAMYDSSLKTLIVLDGAVTLEDGSRVETNQLVYLNGTVLSTGNFDRETLKTEAMWRSILSALEGSENLPLTLTDLKAPTITVTAPSPGTSTEVETITITGSIDEEVTLTLNGSNIVLSNNQFNVDFNLNIGVNELTLVATDAAGNQTTETITVTRTEPAPAATPESMASCNQGGFNDQLLCLINQYRSQNGLNVLSTTSALNAAAKMHSDWMSANQPNPLTHTWTDGTEFWQRCASAGTTCDAENIAWHTSPSAQTIFTMWQQSPSHNQNMLGSHSYIGIAITGGYVTTVFY